MTQETTKPDAAPPTAAATAPNPDKQIDAQQAEGVSGGVDVCNPADFTRQLQEAYDNLVDTASYVIERVITAAKGY
jgi:hypothetical protein